MLEGSVYCLFKFNNGELVIDKITGFNGIVLARTHYATGCRQYGISSNSLDQNGTLPSWIWLDEGRLKSSGKSISYKDLESNSGGPQPIAPTA